MVNTYVIMMPHAMTAIQALAESCHDLAIQSFELLDELCESANAVIAPHVKPLVYMCLAIVANKSLNDELKVKAVSFLGWLGKIKKKALVKHKLVEPIIGK